MTATAANPPATTAAVVVLIVHDHAGMETAEQRGAVYCCNPGTGMGAGRGDQDPVGVLGVVGTGRGGDLLGVFAANDAGEVYQLNPGTIPKDPGMGAGRGGDLLGAVFAANDAGAVYYDINTGTIPNGIGDGRGGDLVGAVFSANDAGELDPHNPGTIPHVPRMGTGPGGEDLLSALPANDVDVGAVYYDVNPGTFPREPSMGAGPNIKDRIGVLPANSIPGAVYHNSGTLENEQGMVQDLEVNLPQFTRQVRNEAGMGRGGGEDHLGAVPANIPVAVYFNSSTLVNEQGMVADEAAFADKVTVTAVGRNKLGGHAFASNVRRSLGGAVGIATASLAIAGLAASGTATTPAAGFGLFTVLLCSLTLVTLRVLAA